MTIGTWLLQLETRPPGIAIKYKNDSGWTELDWESYLSKTISLAEQIHSFKLPPKAHIGILSATRYEWAILDLAITGSSYVTVPLYVNQSDDDLLFIINHSEIELLIIENESFKKQIDRIKGRFLKNLNLKYFQEFDFNLEPSKKYKTFFLKNCSGIKPTDMATIVYTSGTTGIPKGAVLTHESVVSEVEEIFRTIGVKNSFTSLTFLPFAHVMGRAEIWGSCFNGHTLAFAESIEKIQSNLQEIKPDFMIAVPRIFEKIYSGIRAQLETQPLKQKLFKKAFEVAAEVAQLRETKQAIPWPTLLQYETLCRVVFHPIKKAFGGQLQFAVSGGAPLSKELTEFFYYCGIPILEGYGLTETCAAVAINTPYNLTPGTVGRPLPEVQVKFEADGEILIKSKKCMKEYFKNPTATAEVFKNGYFATGDIGEFTAQGQLKITDRKKDLIKTANGKYVAPQKLEGLLKKDSLISQVLIHGDQRKFITALISIDESAAKHWAAMENLIYSDLTEVYRNPALRLQIQKQIQAVNSELANHEAIKKFEVIGESWTIENGAMTPSLKLKRKFLEKKYNDLIEEMYES